MFAYQENGKLLGIDDADIFFTYAQNLVRGNGITYSNGIPLVEGYTSTAWLLLSSIMFFFRMNETGVFVLSIVIFACSQFVFIKLLMKHVRHDFKIYFLIVYTIILSSSFGFVTWNSITLMDTGLWTASLSILFYFLINPPTSRIGNFGSIASFAIAPLVRPESFFICPLIILISIISKTELKISWKYISRLTSVFLISVGSITAFRYLYFGQYLPNTYFAKVSPSRKYDFTEGFKYVFQFLISSNIASVSTVISIFVCITSIPFFIFKNKKFEFSSAHSFLQKVSLLILCLLSLNLLSGGDHFNYFRMLQPVYPFMILQILILSNTALPSLLKYFDTKIKIHTRLCRLFGIILIVIWSVFFSLQNGWWQAHIQGSQIAHEFQISRNGRQLGLDLNNKFEAIGSYPSIGVITEGGIARTYNGSVYDLMGLNNVF